MDPPWPAAGWGRTAARRRTLTGCRYATPRAGIHAARRDPPGGGAGHAGRAWPLVLVGAPPVLAAFVEEFDAAILVCHLHAYCKAP